MTRKKTILKHCSLCDEADYRATEEFNWLIDITNTALSLGNKKSDPVLTFIKLTKASALFLSRSLRQNLDPQVFINLDALEADYKACMKEETDDENPAV